MEPPIKRIYLLKGLTRRTGPPTETRNSLRPRRLHSLNINVLHKLKELRDRWTYHIPKAWKTVAVNRDMMSGNGNVSLMDGQIQLLSKWDLVSSSPTLGEPILSLSETRDSRKVTSSHLANCRASIYFRTFRGRWTR